MRLHLPVAIAVLTTAAAGCTMVGTAPGPTPSPEAAEAPTPVSTVFGGTVTLGAQEMPIILELSGHRPSDQLATLRIPAVSMEANGEGSWSGDRIRLRLTYGDSCPGTVDVDARVTEEGALGTLSARDCTGSESGKLVLLRRTAPAPVGTPLR